MSTIVSPHITRTPKENSGRITPINRRNISSTNSVKKIFDPEVEIISRSLLEGMDVKEVDSSYLNEVTFWLRNYKIKILKEAVPDYDTAKKIDEINEKLQLATDSYNYSQHQKEKITVLKNKLREAKENLSKVEKTKEKSYQTILKNRKEALEKLQEKQKTEVDNLDAEYQSEKLPPKYFKFSTDVLQMRRLEQNLRNAGFYDKASEMRAEREVVEQYELHLKKTDWEKEWVMKREKLLLYHEQQLNVINERFDLRWNQTEPEYVKRIEYWKKVIGNLESKLNVERSFKREAEKEANSYLNKEGLPSLQTTNRSSTMSRVISVSGSRTYTRPNTVQSKRKSSLA